MDSLKARFSLHYSLTVLAVSAGLCVLAWYLVDIRGMGWSFTTNGLTVTENVVKLVLLALLMLAVFGTQVWDLARPADILVLTPQGLHDRRLTRGLVRWDQISHIHFYRKGWQWMAVLEPKPATSMPDALAIGPMPLYAFNRLCARWLKRPELNVGLGGLTAPTQAFIDYIETHYTGGLSREP